MRVAVISDIHANAHALAAVAADIETQRADGVWCLGDVVGYGPDPNGCCAGVNARATICLAGNHDLAALGRVDIGDFNQDAAAATRWTAAELDEDAREFLSPLEPEGRAEGVELFHASPLDPVWDYVLTVQGALAALQATSSQVVLVGHSHIALAISVAGDRIGGGLAPAGTVHELGDARWLLNPGAVGQPRDGDPRAAYLLLDLGEQRAEFRRVEYPIERTQVDMRERGLPPALAERLTHGL